MVYNPSIPQPTDDLSDSQADLLINFDELNTVYGVDHVKFDASSNKGKHNKATFPTQGNDPAVDSPETEENEYAIFSLTDGSDVELYGREQSNGTVNQLTRDGELFIGMHPVFAINLSDLTPNTNKVAGGYNFIVNNSFNLDTANTRRITSEKCRYHFAFTNQIVDSAGNPTNKYMWVANGFDNSSNPTVGKPQNTNNYGLRVDSTFIEIEFVNQNNTVIGSMTGGSIVCWRVQ